MVPPLKDGKRVTRWFPVNTFPRTAIEEAILHLAKLADPGPTVVGYEWWIQKISEDKPLGFHVDKDESVASNEHYLLHPIWSSVFYVTTEGGGTLITNQWSPHGNGYVPAEAQEGAWSFPEENKFLRFNGTLLHGVVSGKQRGKFKKDRITFLVNFWHVRPKEPNCQLLPHEQVTGLKLLSKKQIKSLRADHAAAPSRPPVPQPLIVVDSRRDSEEVDTFDFQMDLPGRQTQMLTLPKLEPKGGETYYLHFKVAKKIFARAKKAEREARANAKKMEKEFKKQSKKRQQKDKDRHRDRNRDDEKNSSEKGDEKRNRKDKKRSKKRSKRSDRDDDDDDDHRPSRKKKSKGKKSKKNANSKKLNYSKAGTYSERFVEAQSEKNEIKKRNRN